MILESLEDLILEERQLVKLLKSLLLKFEEPELLIPPKEDALPDELVPGGAPVGKGGLDI